ncbi:acyl-CoA dehydrogenase family protein [Candidatus Berkiella aquae]|uniref:glutaryl-CoA dehydrogenase (ETF) n=1 Tax=Candidatus Berkiella aquae TaxID=295108 RepID=A0A0Q9YM60_9GAMM|nr:acyl-CoA dehydrogenase family protein [Candidatus Berkiella aquae]MCS5710123.1 acyl-CoA dehydrogenase family protein [Candidatus Berkiella aquae]
MEDLFCLDDYLSDEEKLVRDSVRRFIDSEIMPIIADCYEKAHFPRELIQKMANLGLFGMTLPESYGGANASSVAYGLACQELERGDSGLRSFVSVQSSLCMYPIFAYGTQQQKMRFLPQMAQGELIGCFGLTEPDSGSDPASMKTRAKKANGGWRLTGAKMWITNATIADLAIVWAKDEQGNVKGFIVERDFPGFSTNEIHHKLSLRASITGEIVLEDCFVPDENYLPGTEKGLACALGCLTKARYGIAWGAMGAAMACYDIALNYAKERTQFGKAIGAFQLIQTDLVDMFTEIVKAQALNLQLGRLHEQERSNYVMVSLAKMNACKEALHIARKARNILGANGISLEYHIIRHMANLESVFTYEGTDNMHHLIVGKHITGLDAFS